MNGDNGYTRKNTSWIIGRIMRDYDHWMDDEVRTTTADMLAQKEQEERDAKIRVEPGSGDGNRIKPRTRVGLCVAFYRAEPAKVGTGGEDFVYYSGFFVMGFQLGIAAIPMGFFGDWSILMVTGAAIILAIITGSLEQWRREKWACRDENKRRTVVITRGNGAQHAIIVNSDRVGLDLEDLSAGTANVEHSASVCTRGTLVLLALLWICLLIAAAGIEKNTWFLLAVGGLGILQNIYVAAWWRKPVQFGVPLTYDGLVAEPKTMKTLYNVEQRQAGLGQHLRSIFFPGGSLRDEEEVAWAYLAGKTKYSDRIERLRNNGQLDNAEEWQAFVIRSLAQELGEQHRYTLENMAIHALILRDLGRDDEAGDEEEEIHKRRKRRRHRRRSR